MAFAVSPDFAQNEVYSASDQQKMSGWSYAHAPPQHLILSVDICVHLGFCFFAYLLH
jgi:hypothetical protein